MQHEQGISKAGNRWVRALAINTAWAWLRFQPKSQLARWYQTKFGKGSSRVRKIGIVALARKLLIALWRYSIRACFRRAPCCAANASRLAEAGPRLERAARHCRRVSRAALLVPFVRRSPFLPFASTSPLADSQSSGARRWSTRIGGCSRAISSESDGRSSQAVTAHTRQSQRRRCRVIAYASYQRFLKDLTNYGS
jgi:hypothetical protein